MDVNATPQEIFQQHVAALTKGDFDVLETQYAESAVVLTASGEYRGRTAIRALFEKLAQALPHVSFEAQVAVFADNMLLLEWTANSDLTTVPDGVDTFVFGEGRIQAQTISCTLTPKDAGT